MAKKSKKNGPTPVDAIKHKESRVNIPTEELRDFVESYLAREIARQSHLVWAALSRASHHHAYELSPTRDELIAWFTVVEALVEQTESRWRK